MIMNVCSSVATGSPYFPFNLVDWLGTVHPSQAEDANREQNYLTVHIDHVPSRKMCEGNWYYYWPDGYQILWTAFRVPVQ